MTRLAYIPDDGYTEPGFVRGVPGLHPDCGFAFRPTLTEEVEKLLGATEDKPGQVIEQLHARAIAGHITTWDLADAAGKALPITVANVLRLKRRLLQRFRAIVIFGEPTDINPTWPVETIAKAVDEELESALTGDVKIEGDRKN